MRWDLLISEVRTLAVSGDGNADIRGVQYDSRAVQEGDVFVAMRGGTVDGNRFVERALRAGAAGIITDDADVFSTLRDRALPAAHVEHGRRALAEASAAVFDHPERKLKISAVTGTNGKTTTAFLLEQLLRGAGRKCILLGTVENRIGTRVLESRHTTPESRDLLEIFAQGVKEGCTEVVMEMSSHALAQERVWGIPVDVAMFTNLTQDHLDFHGSMENYARAKARMFEGVGAPPPRVAVINDDDWWGREQFAHQVASSSELMLYGTKGAAYCANAIRLSAQGTCFEWRTPGGTLLVEDRLTGLVNVYNLLCAACAALARGLTLEEVARGAAALKPAPGRFEVVAGSAEAGFTTVVDYAHTDDALNNLIKLARGLAPDGRVITMFGCGGDRDRTKRPKMGRAAAEGSDLVIVTSDNPRSEEPNAIIQEVLQGVHSAGKDALVEVDRHAAIELAIRSAGPGDIVLLAGKGHEKTQTFAVHTVPFDDVAEAERVLRELCKQ